MLGRPTDEFDLGVVGGVVAPSAVAVFAKNLPVRRDQDGAERIVARVESLFGEFETTTEMDEIGFGEGH